MSALPPKADIGERGWDVRFVPKADFDRSLDHLVGAGEQRRWHGKAERLGGFEVDR
jgi:hypothetical protein